MFVVDPRVSDEDVVAMTNDYRQMIEAGGSQVTREESWGRRKLAYTIEKLNEGKYVLFYISSENGKTSLPGVEHRMRQNDKILRFLTVRTDLDLKRAGSRLSPTSPSNLSAAGAGEQTGPPEVRTDGRGEGRSERYDRSEGRSERYDRSEGRYEGRSNSHGREE
jgi:ribosomal protein S6